MTTPADEAAAPDPDAWELVLRDMRARRGLGITRYGKAVDPDDPAEDWLQHAYEEALDQCAYLRAEIARRGKPRPLTDAAIDAFTRQVDSLVVGAASVPDMYRKLNALRTNGRGGWRLLRDPVWVRGVLVGVLLRPEPEDGRSASSDKPDDPGPDRVR